MGHIQAQRGEAAGCRDSLPYAWNLITGLITGLEASDGEFADDHVAPPDEVARGQLLRMMASDASSPPPARSS